MKLRHFFILASLIMCAPHLSKHIATIVGVWFLIGLFITLITEAIIGKEIP